MCHLSTEFCENQLRCFCAILLTKKTRSMALKSATLTGARQHHKCKICIQFSASLSLLLSLQFPLIILLHLCHHSVLCANHWHPSPQPLSIFSWAYLCLNTSASKVSLNCCPFLKLQSLLTNKQTK